MTHTDRSSSAASSRTHLSRQSHWPALTYYLPCFDFSESVRANADNLINIHKSSSLIILVAIDMVISSIICGSFVILSVLFVGFFPFL